MRIYKHAFTLVELLVVITIIGIIMGLTLPALNAARESARVLQCKNHLKQLGTACWTHNSEQLTLPTGGWGWQFAGDPARGFRELQTGGWLYNILPYMDNRALHDMPGPDRMKTPVSEFHCPSKRKPIRYPFSHSGDVMCYRPSLSSNSVKTFNGETEVARNDYAANGGTRADPCITGTSSGYFDALNKYFGVNNSQAIIGVRNYFKGEHNNINDNTGAYCPGGAFSIDKISGNDGASNTIMLGERHVNPDEYYTGTASDDDQGWDQGYDRDTTRWGGADKSLFGMAMGDLNYTPAIIDKIKAYYTRQNLSKNHWIPIQDKAGYTSPSRWGSPHGDTINFCMVDASVVSVSYGVDPFIFYCLCSHCDGQAIPGDVLK